MGKSSGSAPAAPDPAQTIPLQSQYDQLAFDRMLNASRTNTTGPTGTQTWNNAPSFDEAGYNSAVQNYQQGNSSINPTRDQYTVDKWTQTTQLSPEQQQLYNQTTGSQLNALQQAQQATQQPVDFSSAPELGNVDALKDINTQIGALDPLQFNKEAADAIYNQGTRYLDPQLQQQQRSMEGRLAEQGFVPGTPAYNQAMQNFQDTSNRAYAQARDQATSSGVSSGQVNFGNRLGALQSQAGNTLQGGQFQNQIRNQSIAEILQRRNQPLNELSAIRTGSAVQMPQGGGTTNTPNLQAPDILGAANNQYMGQLGGYNADISQGNAQMGTVGSLAMAAAMYF